MTLLKHGEAVASAIQREASIGNFLLVKYREKLSSFEKNYNLPTPVFLKKFEAGNLGDSEDFFEWFAIAQAEKHWTAKMKELMVS